MSAPDPKAVEGAIAKLARDGGCDCADCRARVTLIAAARAYLRAPTAPQGAEPTYRPALAALMDYKQADEDGVMVLVSRQAIHEVFDALTWHDKHAAPQGAEIARMPRLTAAMIVAAANVEPPCTAGEVIARYQAMYDAALTPTDAETKHGS